jgi:hypothetical protein
MRELMSGAGWASGSTGVVFFREGTFVMDTDFTMLEKVGIAALLGVSIAVLMGWLAPHALAAIIGGGAAGLAWKLFLVARAAELGW